MNERSELSIFDFER
ncbi:hypothetical protein KE3_0422 [Streptococcus lutetiensis 033]|uniref:Uncharacterized protein n=1 Tax=Streptococcus lutetiensis 033 TaxID=1076934 RepID=A0AB33AKB1_9STRE|nr:hypothetical protein KE3_0422 [Streptococcus lutetiensis 033]